MKIPLGYWYYFIFYYQRNASAKELSEVLGISYKTALRMVRRIQKSLENSCSEVKLKDIVEFDELYLSVGQKGRKNMDRPPRKRGLKLRGRGTMDKDKPPIIGACDRNGNLRLKVSGYADSNSICSFFLVIMAVLSDRLKVFTDDFTTYRFLDKTWIPHESVNHSIKEYARGEIHNNTMEGYWSVFRHWILKFFKNFKAIKFQRNFNVNTYRRVSKDHLPEYVSFFEFVETTKRRDGFSCWRE